ncbi:PREDICTED: thyrotroph embryonic factor isoform X1 [Rhinopithecus bieti]|uniref:thyrotroph embryonic factor isoform X1 n=1 Tax=Rhinopithecus bieti TaxID=61621 RepID=UPI00083BD8C0|nr:PREDICTED: thyrotroph embryonic factor isoform X1 [Rhinopithecus bieti]
MPVYNAGFCTPPSLRSPGQWSCILRSTPPHPHYFLSTPKFRKRRSTVADCHRTLLLPGGPGFLPGYKEKGKEKLEEDEAAAASTMAVSASLMPPIWDKTIPYDGESFHLEYMDLDEFLLENGIPASPTHLAHNLLLPVAELEGKESASSSTASPPSSSTAIFQTSETVSSTESSLEKERETPSPIDPNCVEVDVNFNPDPADLVLSSVPGGELFNPRKHKFAEEDLKPQPMIKKAKKVFVPDEQKDEKYWTRRKKNNVAAKRSRDARRLKENQITIRAAFLEKENTALRTEVAELRKEVGKCKTIVSKYETKYGPL